MRNLPAVLFAAFLAASCSTIPTDTVQHLPGKMDDGRTLLPNGWILSPAGSSIDLGDLPLGMQVSPNGKFAAIVNSGEGKQTISLVDIRAQRVVQTLPVKKSWMGIRFNGQGNKIFVSAGNDNGIHEYVFEHDSASYIRTIELGKPFPAQDISPTDILLNSGSSLLYVTTKGNNSLYKIDASSGKILGMLAFSHPLYSCTIDENRHFVYVSLWGGSQIAVVDADSMTAKKFIPVGDHPNEMVETTDGRRLFVANANFNTVSVIGLETMTVIETISTSVSPDALNGSTPNSLALSPDNSTLYVANADNNFLAVIDVEKYGESRAKGFIPSGWYPTVVRCVDKLILVANGKGMISKANPHHEYIASLLQGTLSFIPDPGKEELAKYSAQVFQNTPLTRMHPAQAWDDENPVPKSPSTRSPIKHIFYIIKENRTYDQLFGDLAQGNGDSALSLFGKDVTPNHHALAEEFALLDNYYEDAEVSADGHNWSMAAYATDFVEKTWPTFYGGRGGEYIYEKEGITSPSAGYIWDDCIRHKVSLRNYGEFVDDEDTANSVSRVKASGLLTRTSPNYRGWDLDYSDVQRANAWQQEFDAYDKGDSLPQFEIIKLPNDHTAGSRRGSLSPRAMVAQNDRALGMIVERISHSRFWKESAIFVLEDDAQNGPDHVDAHRSIALVVSPYTKREYVDHSMYSTSGMLRTMELILRLPPMSQYDASATPMFASFSSLPDMTPFTARENIIDIYEKNALGAYGQERMEAFDLSREDQVPDNEFNQIIWKSVKGTSSEMPAPVHSTFITTGGHDDDDD